MLYAAAAAGLAYALRLLRLDGAVAAFVVGSLILEGGGLGMAIALLLFFCTCIALGRTGRRRKESLGGDLAPAPRSAVQVLANGGAAAAFCAINLLDPSPAWLVGALAALCAANADTWATEVGLAFGRAPFRITTLQPSRPGPSGVVSVQGIVAALAGSMLIAATSPLLGLTASAGTVAVAGFCGALFDSVLGDTLQRRDDAKGVRWMTNDMVNLLSTCAAGAAGYWLG